MNIEESSDPENNYVLVIGNLTGKTSMLYSQRAYKTLDCFANMSIFFSKLLEKRKIISENAIKINGFGFLISNDGRSWAYHVDEETGDGYFLINYLLINKRRRQSFRDGALLHRSMVKGNPDQNIIWSRQFFGEVQNCVIGCFSEFFCSSYNFDHFFIWKNKLRDVASFYAYELDCFDRFFRVTISDLDLYVSTIRDQWGLPYEYIATRKEYENER